MQSDAARAQDGAPPDPESDVLGWENGYWYNESLSIVRDDGINKSERQKIVARAMARVERIRRLEFRKKVPVRVIPREQFQNRSQDPVEDRRRTFDNVKFEALFMVNETTNSLAVQERNAGSSIGGFYSPTEDSIVVISETRPPKVDELTLAHELVHALQDQHFDLTEFNRSTREEHNEIDGLVEGDANYVQYRYTRNCNQNWSGTCLERTGRAGGGNGTLANAGIYLLKYQPYSDGPPFVAAIRNASGWDGVNALYEDPPNSTEQVIHPELYGEDLPSEVELRDESNEDWRRVKLEDRGVNYAEFGEAGLFTMLLYPSLTQEGTETVIPRESFATRNPGTNQNTLDAYNYSHPATAGWDGDKLYAYVNENVPENETGYVWKTVWDSEKDARQFAEAYRKLLNIHGAQQVEGRPNAWVIPDDREFADAFHVERRGDTVVVVNAPTVDQLSGVYADVTPEAESNASSRSRVARAQDPIRSA
ncbi:Hvo_1808 family surface protein [Halorussus sp. MSC15.2]|uniref:Hvo_1808 family surface protein n=1 Tax=Halorussus sp. MSC15.2 TaxID=2283638 RepID=UPI002814B1EB|nr:Hvo_1808 family surface protein [Halorussus sp. MSC15.2]